MVDTVPQIEPEEIPGAIPEEPKSPSFFSTGAGKVVIAVVAVFVLLIVAGVALFLFFLRTPEPLVEPPSTSSTVQTSGDTTTVVDPVNPAEKPLSSTFVFRNIFAPSVKAPAPPRDTSTAGTTDTDGTSSDGGGGTTAGSNELMLMSIQTTDGERTATFSWNGNTYVLSKGDDIPDSPWKVVDIGSDSVSVIYGDSSPIELTVGSSVSK